MATLRRRLLSSRITPVALFNYDDKQYARDCYQYDPVDCKARSPWIRSPRRPSRRGKTTMTDNPNTAFIFLLIGGIITLILALVVIHSWFGLHSTLGSGFSFGWFGLGSTPSGGGNHLLHRWGNLQHFDNRWSSSTVFRGEIESKDRLRSRVGLLTSWNTIYFLWNDHRRHFVDCWRCSRSYLEAKVQSYGGRLGAKGLSCL